MPSERLNAACGREFMAHCRILRSSWPTTRSSTSNISSWERQTRPYVVIRSSWQPRMRQCLPDFDGRSRQFHHGERDIPFRHSSRSSASRHGRGCTGSGKSSCRDRSAEAGARNEPVPRRAAPSHRRRHLPALWRGATADVALQVAFVTGERVAGVEGICTRRSARVDQTADPSSPTFAIGNFLSSWSDGNFATFDGPRRNGVFRSR
jgi:hypothetical protein